MAMTDSELREIFDLFDENKDGEISLEEFAQAFKKLGNELTEGEGLLLFKLCDLDKSGKVDFEEFRKFTSVVDPPSEKPLNEDALRALFNAFDDDGNGLLDKEEVLNVCKLWGGTEVAPEELDKEWSTIDTNGDGVIDFEEFKKFLSDA